MQYSLMTEPQMGGTYSQLLGFARFAEESGMVSFARSDHYGTPSGAHHPTLDAFTTLGGLARETSRVRLCVLVSPVTFRHPAVIAKAAATVDEMSGGRLDLGLGTGWMEREHQDFGLDFPPSQERFARLEEALGYLRAAFTGEKFAGRFYRLETPEVLPRPQGVRLIVGGSGPHRTPTLAGRMADEYNQLVTAEPLAPRLEVMRQAAQEAGRDPAAVEVTMMGQVVTGRSESEYREVLAKRAAARSLDPAEYEQRLAAAGVPHGPSSQVRETLAALEEAGVTRFYLQWLDLSDLDGCRRTVEAVLG